MNKKIVPFLGIAAAMAGGLVSCSDEQTLSVGEGTIYVSTRVNSDIVVESRADAEEDLAASTVVWIYSDQGVVRKYNGMAEVPAGGIKLISGDYTVKAWAGTLSYASFTDRWFEGAEALTVEAGKSIACEVVCKIANVVTSVKYPENIDQLISDYSLTVSHKGGSLTFEGLDERKGYFMMPEGVSALDYVMTFSVEGKEKTVRGTINDVEPAHEYVLNIIANPAEDDPTGAAWITIEVDDTMVDVEETITITPPPSITGFGFDMSAPVAGESGAIGRRSVCVAAAAPLTSVEVTGLPNCPGFEEGVNFIHATQSALDQLAALGITCELTDVDGGQLMKIVFADEYLNAIPNSDAPYVINFTATDNTDKTSSATMTLRISEAPVVAAPVTDQDVTYTSATLTGTVAKDGVEAVGFQYAPAGSSDWIYVSGSTTRAALAKGQAFYATVTGLECGVTYQYRAVQGTADNIVYTSDAQEFTTNVGPQIANNSFEGWYTEGKVEMPVPNANIKAWDTGNHGSSTMNVTLTQKSTDMKHSGTYSARLRSQFVGIGSIGKFAAGNLFFGKYLKTVGTNGVVGFGHEFAFPEDEIKPVALRAWVNYRPAKVQSKGKGSHLAEGATDVAHIFIALFDGPDNGALDAEYNGKHGFVVYTENQKRLFDLNDARIVAYGEKVLDSNYGPDGQLQELIIPLEYREGKGNPTYMSVVFTASKFGDYFEGGEGSLMYVDDVELVYGKR